MRKKELKYRIEILSEVVEHWKTLYWKERIKNMEGQL